MGSSWARAPEAVRCWGGSGCVKESLPSRASTLQSACSLAKCPLASSTLDKSQIHVADASGRAGDLLRAPRATSSQEEKNSLRLKMAPRGGQGGGSTRRKMRGFGPIDPNQSDGWPGVSAQRGPLALEWGHSASWGLRTADPQTGGWLKTAKTATLGVFRCSSAANWRRTPWIDMPPGKRTSNSAGKERAEGHVQQPTGG